MVTNSPLTAYTGYRTSVYGLVERALSKMAEVGAARRLIPSPPGSRREIATGRIRIALHITSIIMWHCCAAFTCRLR